jgi:hypothetical protein
MARANNVVLVVFPSHCTHRLQPLDISVFKSINLYYDKAVGAWLREHPGRTVTEYDIGQIFSTAYTQAATMANAISGYRKAGINPFDRSVFTEEDFIAADVTERDQLPTELMVPSAMPSTSSHEADLQSIASDPQVGTSVVDSRNPADQSTSSHDADLQSIAGDPQVGISVEGPLSPHVPFQDMFPVPKQVRASAQRKRKCAHARVITASPHKKELENMKKRKEDQAKKMIERKECKAVKARLKQQKEPRKDEKATKKKREPPANKSKKTGRAHHQMVSVDEEDNTPCQQCQFRYQQIDDPKSDEGWMSCSTCCGWFHMSCAEENGILDDTDFTCRQCIH